jgi:hypothetical protein
MGFGHFYNHFISTTIFLHTIPPPAPLLEKTRVTFTTRLYSGGKLKNAGWLYIEKKH